MKITFVFVVSGGQVLIRTLENILHDAKEFAEEPVKHYPLTQEGYVAALKTLGREWRLAPDMITNELRPQLKKIIP